MRYREVENGQFGLWCRSLGIAIAMVSMLAFGACGSKKIGLITGEECDSNEQCLSGNCADLGGKKSCQPKNSGKVCSPGSTQSCVCSDGKSGNQTCDVTGQSWGTCTCTGGPTQNCVPNSTKACTCTDGKSGSQTCDAAGQAYGTCACSGGPLCTPGGTQGCICPNNQKGSQSCNSDGKSWGQCQCQSTNNCTPGSTQACACPGGSNGSQTCDSSGQSWGQCQCGSGNACTPGSTQACTCPGGGNGSQTCNSDGKGWGACGCGSGKKNFGTECGSKTECNSGFCISDPGSGKAFCSQRCETTPCPSGYACTNGENNAQICGKIQANAQPFGSQCQNLLGCQSLVCWRGACTQRCDSTGCPSGYNCVTYNDSFKFCSTGVCQPKNYNLAVECAKKCQNNTCVLQCQATHMSPACQDCYLKFVQCVTNSGCDANNPSCCANEQKACFGP